MIIIYWDPQRADCTVRCIVTINGSSFPFHFLGRSLGLERFQDFSKDNRLEKDGIGIIQF